MRLFDRFFERHRTKRNRVLGMNQVHFGGPRHRWKFMNEHGNGGIFRQSERRLNVLLQRLALEFLDRLALFAQPLRLMFERLLLQVVERFIDRREHVVGLGQSHNRTVGRVDGDFGFMLALFDGQNYLGLESVAQNLAEFVEAGFNFFADGGSNFVFSRGIFHVHCTLQ